MANIYVYSGAGGAGTGADWANAYTTLSAALTAGSAGDNFFVAHDHSESTAGAITLTVPGTVTNPSKILCVDRSGSVPPVSADLDTTAIVTMDINSTAILSIRGYGYFYGITFRTGTTGTSGANSIQLLTVNTSFGLDFEECTFALRRNDTGEAITIGEDADRANVSQVVTLRNCHFSFANADQRIGVYTPLVWRGGSLLAGSAIPTSLFRPTLNTSKQTDLYGVDLSQITTGSAVFDGGTNMVRLSCVNCRLGSGGAFSAGSAIRGTRARLINSDSSGTNYKYEYVDHAGAIREETTIVRTGGANDGTTPISYRFATSANALFISPLVGDPYLYWNETTGSSITVTVEVITDNVTLTDAEAWVEVEYLGSSSYPISSFVNDRAADILATPANQTSSSETWTTTGLTTPVKQKLSVTFTPQMKGLFRARVCIAKPSTTVYVCPKLTIS